MRSTTELPALAGVNQLSLEQMKDALHAKLLSIGFPFASRLQDCLRSYGRENESS